MTTDYKIRDEKLQYAINRGAVKLSALSSAKIDKYNYLTGEEMLSFNQRQTVEEANFAYSLLGKALEKQIEKAVPAVQSLDGFNKK